MTILIIMIVLFAGIFALAQFQKKKREKQEEPAPSVSKPKSPSNPYLSNQPKASGNRPISPRKNTQQADDFLTNPLSPNNPSSPLNPINHSFHQDDDAPHRSNRYDSEDYSSHSYGGGYSGGYDGGSSSSSSSDSGGWD